MSTVVVADTGPIHYLYLIGEIEMLPAIFGQIHIPRAVYSELATPVHRPRSGVGR